MSKCLWLVWSEKKWWRQGGPGPPMPVSATALQETRATLHETRATLQEIPATLQKPGRNGIRITLLVGTVE